MATYTVDEQDKSSYEYKYKADYESDWDIHRNYIQTFDAYEAMLTSQVYDSVSHSVDGSKITDSYASTLAKERADRVIAKLPDGETKSIGRADIGKALFMDILRQKWIYPNANAQRPFVEKLNLWQLYSSVYGYMPMFYDWTASNTGYVGPDCWLWNPRNLIPQQGRVSIEDMDYVTALTWLSPKKLKDILDNPPEKGVDDGWDRTALRELLNKEEKIAGNDTEQDTLVTRDRTPQGTKKGICLATRYEAGPDGIWCTFAPDHGFVKVRELDNPHKNGRIPFVVKYSQPLFDSFYGLGDFQRAKPLQFARDGLTNFYFANLKRNLAPGIIVNANGVIKHTLDVTKANPVLMETIPNSIRPMPTNTAGLSTYQGAQSNLTGSLLSLFGTQNASLPGAEALNPSQGKTPAAIGLYSDKEATRDGSERRHLETAIEQLTDGFFSMIVNIGTEDIPVELFADDIEDIVKAGYGDVTSLFQTVQLDETATAGTLMINPSVLQGVEYRFNIAPNSTAQENKDQQRTALENWIATISKLQNVIQQDPRTTVNWNEIMDVYGALTGIKGVERFITFDESKPTPEEQEEKLKQAQDKPPSESINYADVPPDVKAQMEQAAGLQPSMIHGIMMEQMVKESQDAMTQQPTVNKAGMFNDPQIAQVAEQIASS